MLREKFRSKILKKKSISPANNALSKNLNDCIFKQKNMKSKIPTMVAEVEPPIIQKSPVSEQENLLDKINCKLDDALALTSEETPPLMRNLCIKSPPT